MTNVVLTIQILAFVLAAIRATICILIQANRVDHVLTLLLMMLTCLILDAKFGTGIIINVLNVLTIGIL
jgi:hypothetical protein